MLTDLKWTNPDPTKFIDWDDENGSLKTVFVYDDEKFDHTVAIRVQKGIYIAHGLDNSIGQFTKFEVEHPWEESHALFNKMLDSTNSDERECLRSQLIRIPETYGRADSLKQIIKRGRLFLKCETGYVLETHWYDNTNEKSHKAGPYIGDYRKYKEPDEVIAFSWHKLKVKG